MELRTDRHNNPIASKAYTPTMNILSKSGLQPGQFSTGESTAGIDTDAISTVKYDSPNSGYVGSRALLSNGQLQSWYTNPKYGGSSTILSKLGELVGAPVAANAAIEEYKKLPINKQNELIKTIYNHEGGSGKLTSITDNFDKRIDKSRQLGATDTNILNKISQVDPDLKARIDKSRQLYGSQGSTITNDRDLLNMMSQKFSGNMPKVSSIPSQEDVHPETQQLQQSQSDQPTSQYNQGDNVGKMLLKGVSNTPKDFLEFGKSMLESLNPIENIKNTVNNVSQIPTQFQGLVKDAGGVLPALWAASKEAGPTAYHALVPQAFQQALSGDIEGAKKTLTEHPVSTIAPLMMAAKGIKGKLATELPKATESLPLKVTSPEATSQPLSNKPGLLNKVVTSSISHVTSMDPESIRTIVSNPDQFSKIVRDNISRGGLAGEVKNSIDSRINSLKETGSKYEPIKQSTSRVSTNGFSLDKILKDNGFQIKKRKIVANTKSITRDPSDIKALQAVYNNWNNKTLITPAEFLNMRSDLANLKYTESGLARKGTIPRLADKMRITANNIIRPQIKGLSDLDDKFSTETLFLKQIKKDYLNPDGTFKDNAVSKIANAGNKSQVLNRLEQIMPGVTRRLKIVKAIEDIERANGQKVGTYTRGAFSGVALITGNVPGLIATIMTHPENATQILRAAGYVGPKVSQITKTLGALVGMQEIPKATKTGVLTGLAQQQLQDKNKQK